MSDIKLYRPAELDRDEWRQLQSVERDVCTRTLNRTQAEVDALVEWDDPALFMASHLDPNTDVGKRHIIPNQAYAHPRVAVAIEGDKPIGFAYSAGNVSGDSELSRFAKRLSVVRNYLWIGGIAVTPEHHQRRGVEKDLGRTLLRGAMSLQPVTVYVWPDEYKDKDPGFMGATLEQLGFVSTGQREVDAFGEDSTLVTEVRWQAPSARAVLKNLNYTSGA